MLNRFYQIFTIKEQLVSIINLLMCFSIFQDSLTLGLQAQPCARCQVPVRSGSRQGCSEHKQGAACPAHQHRRDTSHIGLYATFLVMNIGNFYAQFFVWPIWDLMSTTFFCFKNILFSQYNCISIFIFPSEYKVYFEKKSLKKLMVWGICVNIPGIFIKQHLRIILVVTCFYHHLQ